MDDLPDQGPELYPPAWADYDWTQYDQDDFDDEFGSAWSLVITRI